MIETIGSEEEARRVVYASYNNVIEDVVVGQPTPGRERRP